MTDKQRRFVEEYLIDLNATQAAVRAGYAVNVANRTGSRLLSNVDIKKAIEERMESKTSELIASQDEVLKYLTSVMRGTAESEEIVVLAKINGTTEPMKVTKHPSEKDKLKAAELMGKRYGIFTDKIQAEIVTPVFDGEGDLTD
jgi:phage terminase small subunit